MFAANLYKVQSGTEMHFYIWVDFFVKSQFQEGQNISFQTLQYKNISKNFWMSALESVCGIHI